MFIGAKSREAMKGYSRSRQQFLELLSHKYFVMEEEKIGCLGIGEESTDYVLCEGDSDLLPTLFKKDEIRFTYNQYKYQWSYVSCTIFAAVGMASDLTNYQFSYEEIKEIDEMSYQRGRVRGHGWYVQSAVKLVRDRWNANDELVKKYGKLAFYRISKYNDSLIENTINNLYTIDGNYCPTIEYNKDRLDLMIDGTDFGKNTNGHSVDVICKEGQRSVKDSGSVEEKNIYGLKHKLSEISNYGQYFYVYTLVKEDNYERIKKLNEMKAKIVNGMDVNSELWHLSGSEYHKDKLHEMNDFYREWLNTINEELKRYL